jgi:hypothetical protein
MIITTNLAFSQFEYGPFDSLLQKYVVGNQVKYGQLMKEKEILYGFTSKMGEVSPHSHPEKFETKEAQLAYWINAYNAFILKLIVDNYPVESIKDINFIGFTVWLKKNLIGGTKISFKSLEDDIIRNEFRDPRIHFAINCASVSCPPLQKRVYLPTSLDQQMDESTKLFINNNNNFEVDESNKIIYISAIFDWYDNDFYHWLENEKNIKEPHLLDYIKFYYEGEMPDEWYSYEIKFFDYDWGLNDYKSAEK